MHELAANAVQSLGLLSLALEQRRVTVDAEDIAELSRACSRLAAQLNTQARPQVNGAQHMQGGGDADELELVYSEQQLSLIHI